MSDQWDILFTAVERRDLEERLAEIALQEMDPATPTIRDITDLTPGRGLPPLVPWFDDPDEIARLYEWLEHRGHAPGVPAHFIRHAIRWEHEYRRMLTAQGD